jgi:hypothetical protein
VGVAVEAWLNPWTALSGEGVELHFKAVAVRREEVSWQAGAAPRRSNANPQSIIQWNDTNLAITVSLSPRGRWLAYTSAILITLLGSQMLSRGTSAAKAQVNIGVGRRRLVAPDGGLQTGIIQVPAAAGGFIHTGFRAGGILCRRVAIIILGIPVRDPFPDIPSHVISPIRTDPAGV